MGTLLKGLSRVPWGELRDARGSAWGVPGLLGRVAWAADAEVARAALEEIGERVCELGFVVCEATAYTVPFLLDLAGSPDPRHLACKADVLELLLAILTAQQWPSHLAEQVGWETASHDAVRAGRSLIEGLAASVHPDVAAAASRVLLAMDQDP
ncbi:hypothetical protein ACFT9I_19895 [Streptomyces sp. NPDC057137]|uniref:hypothetical protein n=1 Tax=Streptomyces sp. NPDC057137 TaxID=3346030 RepID=UPI00362C9C07